MTFENLQDAVGKVISDKPYVKILALPRYREYELVPGMVVGRWEALAQVNHTLAMVELKIIGDELWTQPFGKT